MKAAVVYYSLEGHTKFAAERIARELRADLVPLLPVKDYPKGQVSKYFWAGKSATFREAPKLKAYSFDAEGYDLLVLGTPVWAGTFAPPLRTFMRENRLAGKKAAFFACCSGGSTDRCFEELQKEIPGCSVLATLRLVDPAEKDKPEEVQRMLDFCEKIKSEPE